MRIFLMILIPICKNMKKSVHLLLIINYFYAAANKNTLITSSIYKKQYCQLIYVGWHETISLIPHQPSAARRTMTYGLIQISTHS